MSRDPASRLFTPILIGSCLVLMTGFAIRASFGVFQIPIAADFSWLRAEFSFAIAIQNLAWGVGQPVFGAIAEKFGDKKAIVLGALMYAAGLMLSAGATTPLQHQLLEIVIGFGIAGTGFGVLLALVGRHVAAEKRSLALGITTAAGSAGQVIGPMAATNLLKIMPWPSVFIVFAAVILAVLAVLPWMKIRPLTVAQNMADQKMSRVLKVALKDPTFALVTLGFFSCGYQLGFVTAHFPAFVTEICGSISPDSLLQKLSVNDTADLGAFAIALIGAANIAGTIVAGLMGKHWPKKYLLSIIYTLRTFTAAAFIYVPMTATTVVLFSLTMGFLWLATVPLTSGLVADIYGVKYMGTLYGIVFLSHQIGSFMGVWLGGILYDQMGSYDLVWWVGVGVGAFSALVHLPVRERPNQELALGVP